MFVRTLLHAPQDPRIRPILTSPNLNDDPVKEPIAASYSAQECSQKQRIGLEGYFHNRL